MIRASIAKTEIANRFITIPMHLNEVIYMRLIEISKTF